MKAFVCDRCGDLMKRSVDAEVTIDNHEDKDSKQYHACSDCASEIAVYCSGNE